MNSRAGNGGAPCSGTTRRTPSRSRRGCGRTPRGSRPLRPVGRRVAGEDRRDVRPAHLERVARHDPDVRRVGGHQRRERDDVVLDDHVGPLPGDDLLQLRLAVLRAVDQRLERRLHERRELLAGRLGELRRRLLDEVDPELACRLCPASGSASGRRREVDQVLDEAVRREPARPRRSAANTTRCPVSSSTLPRPMHWLVGPYADSGMNSTVSPSCIRCSRAQAIGRRESMLRADHRRRTAPSGRPHRA